MTPLQSPGHRHRIGISRRELLQVGYTGLLGLSLPSLLTHQAVSAEAKQPVGRTRRKAKSVIIVFLTGAPSHIDTFDLKPDAPPEIRGEFKPIATKVPGMQVCEHLPRLAARADKYAARPLAVAPREQPPRRHAPRADRPSAAGGVLRQGGVARRLAVLFVGLDYLRPRNDGIPSGVNLPTFLMEGPLTWPGQHAGFLGPQARSLADHAAIPTRPTSAWTACAWRRGWRSTGSTTGGRCSSRSISQQKPC